MISAPASSLVASSTTRPRGTKVEARKTRCMASIPFGEPTQGSTSIPTKMSQNPNPALIDNRTFENQAYRASGLNLLVAAVIMWNTRYLQLAAADLRVGPETMRQVAPLGWEHLSLTGDYAWHAEGQPTPGELRPLGARTSLLAA